MYAPIELAISLIFILLAIFFPYQGPALYAQANFKSLHIQYAKWELFAFVPLFTYIILIAYFSGNFYSWLFVHTQVKDASLFQYYPADVAWYAFSSIFAFGLVSIPMELTYRFLLKERYEEYIAYTNMKHGFNGHKIIRPLSILLITVSSVLLFFGFKYSVKVFQKNIVFNPFLSFEVKTQNISAISSIYFVEMVKHKKGNMQKPHYYVKFSDGSFWNTNEEMGITKDEDKVMEYLSAQAKVKIDTSTFDPD